MLFHRLQLGTAGAPEADILSGVFRGRVLPVAGTGKFLEDFDIKISGEMSDVGGVPQDYVRAHMWYNLAAAQGDENGRKYRDDVAAIMTPEQIAEAQRLAREWMEKLGQ